jgi:hypothetical protein
MKMVIAVALCYLLAKRMSAAQDQLAGERLLFSKDVSDM